MRWWCSAIAYVVLFGALAVPWLRSATDSVPAGDPLSFPDDARLLVWVLGWVAHALATDPRHLLDANIHYPLRGQLTGSEHLASTQLVGVPLVWLTGNAILVANLVVFLSYPLGALAMQRLLVAYGIAPAVAWVGGLLFALGPFRVPANLQLLQYLGLYLPLALLALRRLRDAPSTGRAIVLAVVVGAGALSSYYMAVMVALLAVTGVVLEAARRVAHRGRFLLLAGAAGGAASVVLGVVSIPYLQRGELGLGTQLGGLASLPVAGWLATGSLLARHLFGVIPTCLALGGCVLLARGGRTTRFACAVGLATLVAGLALVLAPAPVVALIEASPLRFLRAQLRFTVLAGCGIALLAAAFLDELHRRLAGRSRVALLVAVASGALLVRGVDLAGRRDRIAAASIDAPAYAMVATAAGPGEPLLELPILDARFRTRESWLPRGNLEPEGMVGSFRHWLPLLTGHSGYPPPHRQMLDDALAMLPDAGAMRDLVDLTGVRWLLLRPPDYWAAPAVREGLLRADGVETVGTWNGWTLARVDWTSRRPEWIAALAAGPRPGHTLLGTPLAELPGPTLRGRIVASGTMPRTVLPGVRFSTPLLVTNEGPAAWPVSIPPGVPDDHTVRAVVRWQPETPDAAAWSEEVRLRRDVLPGETIAQALPLVAPRVPGPYDVDIWLEQKGGPSALDDGASHVRERITVAVPPRA